MPLLLSGTARTRESIGIIEIVAVNTLRACYSIYITPEEPIMGFKIGIVVVSPTFIKETV